MHDRKSTQKLKRLFLFVFVSLPFFVGAQHTLTVQVKNVASSDGYIAVGVYDAKASFLKKNGVFAGDFAVSKAGTTIVEIPNLPSGTYAVSIFHDANGNKKLDTNFFGIPKEACAFSKAKMRTFGPPSFEACAFKLDANYNIEIPFE